MEHGFWNRVLWLSLVRSVCCPRLPGCLEHRLQPGHRPGEKLSPREAGVTCLGSHHRQRQSRAENSQPGPFLGTADRLLSKRLRVLGPEAWKPVRWGLAPAGRWGALWEG